MQENGPLPVAVLGAGLIGTSTSSTPPRCGWRSCSPPHAPDPPPSPRRPHGPAGDSPAQLADQCARLVEYGAQGVGILDSAGHHLPADVTDRIAAMRATVDVPIMFHGHNSLGMAVANSLAAAEAGADVLDACARGFGAGAGNTQLEVLVPVLERIGWRTGIDLYKLLDAADVAERKLIPKPPMPMTVPLRAADETAHTG